MTLVVTYFSICVIGLGDMLSLPGVTEWYGIALAGISGILLGLYAVLLHAFLVPGSKIFIQDILAFIGLYSVIFGVPILFIFDFAGFEGLEWPGAKAWEFFGIQIAGLLIYQFSYGKSI